MLCVYVMCMNVSAAIYFIVVCVDVLCTVMYCIHVFIFEVSYLTAESQLSSNCEYNVTRFTLYELVYLIILIRLTNESRQIIKS